MDSGVSRTAMACIFCLLTGIPLLAQAGKPAEPAIVAQFQGSVITQEDLLKAAAPALFINGRFVSGAVPFENIARITDEELKAAAQPVRQTGVTNKQK